MYKIIQGNIISNTVNILIYRKCSYKKHLFKKNLTKFYQECKAGNLIFLWKEKCTHSNKNLIKRTLRANLAI